MGSGEWGVGWTLVQRRSRIGSRIKEEVAIWRVGALPGMAVISLVIIARLTGLLPSLEWMMLDRLLRLRPLESTDERIVIIGINEADIRSLGAYPIPDSEIAALLRTLLNYQPRAIGLDIIRDLPVGPSRAQLVAAFKDIKNLIAIEKVLPDEIAPPPELPPGQLGFSDTITDDDGKLRRNLLGTPTPKGYKFSLALRLAEVYLAAEGISLENGIRDRNTMRFGSAELPRFLANTGGYVRADAGGVQVLLNFRNGRKPFQTLSLHDLKTGKFNPSWLRDRIVLIGITSPGVDIKNTAATTSVNPGSGLIYGVEFQAHAVSQIINAVLEERPLLKAWSDGWEYLWILSWGFLGIGLSRLTQSPTRNLLAVGIVSVNLVGVSYLLLALGWWVPLAPAMLAFGLNGVGLTAFYQNDRALRLQIQQRQSIINSTFDTIHNGPLQILASVLKRIREQDLPPEQLLLELERLNSELRAVHEFMRRDIIRDDRLYIGNSLELDLQTPIHELLYLVYNHTLERDSYFKTLKLKITLFDPINERHLSADQKEGLCRFLEEALCNVSKHAKAVTHLSVTFTEEKESGWCILSVTDNGVSVSPSTTGRGTQQSRNLARQLGVSFSDRNFLPKELSVS